MKNKYRAVLKQSLSDLAYHQILKKITSGKIKEGERLIVNPMAKQLDMSVIPIREALVRLNSEKLVTYSLNKGYRVASQPKENDYKDLFLVRMVLETGALRNAIGKVTDSDILDLKDINREILKLNESGSFENVATFVELNEIFHTKLVSFSDSPLLSKLYKELGYKAQTIRQITGKRIFDLKKNASEHGQIIKFLSQGDEDKAVSTLKNHIIKGMGRFMSAYVQ